MKTRIGTENGQALVLIVLALVGLLGLSALAIDGGLTYSDRRFAQNGADASSLGGAGAAAGSLKSAGDSNLLGVMADDWDCTSGGVTTAVAAAESWAINVGQNNGFILSTNPTPSDNGLVSVQCDQTGKFIDVAVTLNMTTTTSLMHFVYGGPVRNTVTAVSRVFPQERIGVGQSIIALDENCGPEKALSFDGGVEVRLDGGGALTYSCLIQNGQPGIVTLINASVTYDTGYPFDPNAADPIFTPISNVDDTDTSLIPKPYIPSPEEFCHGPTNPVPTNVGGVLHYQSGTYTGNSNTINITGGSVVFDPGLYCFYNSAGINITGGDVLGNNVTFFFAANGGTMSTEGNNPGSLPNIVLKAPLPPCSPPLASDCTPAVANLLVYVDPGNSQDVKIGGSSSSDYEGTIYAPSSQVTIGGVSQMLTGFGAQVIGFAVKIHGNTGMNIVYDKNRIYRTDNKLNLER